MHVGGAVRVVELRWKHILKVAALSFAEASAGHPNKKNRKRVGGDDGKSEKAPPRAC